MKILNLVLVSAFILLLMPRCVELEEKPLDFTGPDNFYQNTSQIEAAFASSMQRLFSPGVPMVIPITISRMMTSMTLVNL